MIGVTLLLQQNLLAHSVIIYLETSSLPTIALINAIIAIIDTHSNIQADMIDAKQVTQDPP